ncbi:MAG: DNA-formamidopyrimidine glycosylase [Bacilli bacterium]|nr:DNA-formamidopyrimidine glycosylase [Bacilli bacterium]
MPEIAEVRVVRDTLKKSIVGRKIKNVKLLYPRIISGDAENFKYELSCQIFRDVRSCGKWLIFDLGEYSFLSHLRMEGKYFYVPSNSPVGKHTHVIFKLDNDMDLRYDDVRKFGRMELVKTSQIAENESIKKLGYEPDDRKLTADYLLNKFEGKKIPAKTGLLDQTIINGLGNIYANEVLFASKVNPHKLLKDIDRNEAECIIDNSKRITAKSYEVGGCTIRSYTSSIGVIGHYQDYLLVHGKENDPCPNCGKPIIKEKIDGRSAYYCNSCQK